MPGLTSKLSPRESTRAVVHRQRREAGVYFSKVGRAPIGGPELVGYSQAIAQGKRHPGDSIETDASDGVVGQASTRRLPPVPKICGTEHGWVLRKRFVRSGKHDVVTLCLPNLLAKSSALLSKHLVLGRVRILYDEPQSGVILNKSRFGFSIKFLSVNILMVSTVKRVEVHY